MNYSVDITGLSDSELEFYGWFNVHQEDEFTIYWNSRYNEKQVVDNSAPRFLVVDDWNDVQYLARDAAIIKGPGVN